MNKHYGNSANEAAAEGRSSSVIAGMTMAAGTLAGNSTFQRFIVEEIIFDPIELDDDRIEDLRAKYGLADAAFLKQMPANTVIARLINQSGAGHERFHYLFPFLPQHVMLPIHVGEHVWAFFESDKAIDYGFWMWRVTEPRHIDDVNHTHADRKYHASEKSKTSKDKFEGTSDAIPGFENGPTFVKDGDVITVANSASSHNVDPKSYENLIKDTDAGKISEMESVPRFRKRPGDHVIQGSNNTAIVLGTDRTGRTAKFKKGSKGKIVDGKPEGDQSGEAGSIDIVVGRGQTDKTSGKKVDNSIKKKELSKRATDENIQEGDPDFANDLGRLYMSMKTDPDGNMEINFLDRNPVGVPGGVVKTDHLRIVVRKTLKMLVQPTPGAPEEKCSGLIFKNGNVIILPAADGMCLFGGEDASMIPLCQPAGVINNGQASGAPLVSTLGSQVGIGGPNGQYPKKVAFK
jgi:hypothetical protein